jgi:hypothetical protein
MESTVVLVKQLSLGFLNSPPGFEIFKNGVITGLKVDSTIDSFVFGVVDNKVYKMLGNEQMGREVGE